MLNFWTQAKGIKLKSVCLVKGGVDGKIVVEYEDGYKLQLTTLPHSDKGRILSVGMTPDMYVEDESGRWVSKFDHEWKMAEWEILHDMRMMTAEKIGFSLFGHMGILDPDTMDVADLYKDVEARWGDIVYEFPTPAPVS